ncbi:MAG: hypothetical protein ACQER6_08445 [Pseudomonadota bacterium]
MKATHLILLMLAFWAPFSAVTAGVSMIDCPMTHGQMADMTGDHLADCPSMMGEAHGSADSGLGCDHCAGCQLAHGVSLPTQATAMTLHPGGTLPYAAVIDQIAPGIPNTPFRPPLASA